MYISYDKPFYHSRATECVKYFIVLDVELGKTVE